MGLIKARNGRNGYLLLESIFPENLLETIASEFSVRCDDVYLVTYPKSGTTWMQQILWFLINRGRNEAKKLDDAIPWLEERIACGQSDTLEMMTSQRYIKSHLPYSAIPRMDVNCAKYIYIARNPKDCAVSNYHFRTNLSLYSGTWEDYFSDFIRGEVAFGDWFTHVLDWYNASQEQENIFLTTYEEMHKDLPAVISAIAEFIDTPINPNLTEQAVMHSKFTVMAQNNLTNYQWFDEWKDGIPKMMRKGVVGDWQNHFTVDQNEVFDALYRKKMQNTGLSFDFTLTKQITDEAES